LHLTSVFEG